MSGISPDKFQVLAQLQEILISYDPDFVLPLPCGILSFTYRLVMKLVSDCLTKYNHGQISSEYLEHLQQNISTAVQEAERSQSGELAFIKELAQNVLRVLENPSCQLEHQETSEDDSEEGQDLNIPDCETSQQELNTDLIEGTSVPANTECGICETPEIVHESASAASGSLNVMRSPCKSDFDPIKLISFGNFGAVHLVRHKATKQICAMKKMDKQNLNNTWSLEQAFLERDISAIADCPFLVSMFCSFPTRRHLCMVMEYAPGGDCASLLKNKGAFPNALAQLYIAETVVAVEYLHSHGVVHRDLKPQNLLITATGHIKVTDYGLSKLGVMRPTSNVYKAPTEDIIREFCDKETVGTVTYMAPEVILLKGYGRPVDWWSLGIILYTFYLGYEPFTGATKKEIMRRIVYADIPWTFNEYCPPPKAKELIIALLRKNPAHRLGTGGANEIKMHPFLCDLDFDNLLSQKPVFVPDLKSDLDTSNFNTRYMKNKHVDSDEEDTSEDNKWLEVRNFVSPYQRFCKLSITNTERMTNEEPMSPPGCSKTNTERLTKEEPVSPPQCFITNTEGLTKEEPVSPPGGSITNTERLTKEEPVSPPECFITNTEGLTKEEPVSPPGGSITNTERLTKEEPVSPPGCSITSTERMTKEEPVSPPECSITNIDRMTKEEPLSPPGGSITNTERMTKEPESPPGGSITNTERMTKETMSPAEWSMTNTERLTKEEPVSPPGCSITNTESMTKEPVSPPECSITNTGRLTKEEPLSAPEGLITNTERMTKGEPVSPPECSITNTERLTKEEPVSPPGGCITNTERLTKEEPVSPPGGSEKPSDIKKESSLSKSDGGNQCFPVTNIAASSPSVSESPVQKGRRSALKLGKKQKTETVEEGERRRGSIFRRMISSCRRRLSRAARAVRESCIFACCQRGSIVITENPLI
ncbi:microtubule-associated serine/threonine-protein kinase 4-like [Anomaloglossus baeobatrachus]|uniref:microtubule-associated serine/threonine-protein kinase 4-like n=1 Tax=Anomaloglossus baeobatrachus TaxID=238106 RepID=UPI003F4F7A2A